MKKIQLLIIEILIQVVFHFSSNTFLILRGYSEIAVWKWKICVETKFKAVYSVRIFFFYTILDGWLNNMNSYEKDTIIDYRNFELFF